MSSAMANLETTVAKVAKVPVTRDHRMACGIRCGVKSLIDVPIPRLTAIERLMQLTKSSIYTVSGMLCIVVDMVPELKTSNSRPSRIGYRAESE